MLKLINKLIIEEQQKMWTMLDIWLRVIISLLLLSL